MQRWQAGAAHTTWLAQSRQVVRGYLSRRLAEFSAYYANRLSYEEVARLVERVSGERLLSDQKVQGLVVETAQAVSAQWAAEVAAAPAPEEIAVQAGVDLNDAAAAETLVLSDGICVKQQKAARQSAGTMAPPPERERVRVNTDVWLVQRADGSFRYETQSLAGAGATAAGSVTQRVRWALAQEYPDRAQALPVVVVSDGAANIRQQVRELFGAAVPIILDWYHLTKRVREDLSLAARTKAERLVHQQALLRELWHGRVPEALTYLRASRGAQRSGTGQAGAVLREARGGDH